METILLLAHSQTDGTLPKIARETLTLALRLSESLPGSSLAIGLVGGDVQAAAQSIASCKADRFLAVSGPDFALSRYSTDALALAAIVGVAQPSIVIAPATSRFRRVMPGVAFRSEGHIDTGVSAIDVKDVAVTIQRWYYRLRMFANLSRSHRPWFLLVDSGIADPWEGSAGSAALEKLDIDVPPDCRRTQVIGLQAPSSGSQTIRPDAPLLFVAGAGWTKKQADGQIHAKEAEENILNFLSLTQASLGSSKSLVDQSSEGQQVLDFMSHLNQVGQTGSTPRHPKGLSTCCHGEEPHAVGWRFINERRAINLDANCGWARGKADVLYVADAFQVVAKLNELLSS